jgi:hypothetical protein
MFQLKRRPDVPTEITDQINMLIHLHETTRLTGLAFAALANDSVPATGAMLASRSAEVLIHYELGLLMHRLRTQAIAARAELMMREQERHERQGGSLVDADGKPLKTN